ncbi:SED4 [Candida theae]|uniref:Guanine nucleotide-exchange factor SEC12 n=1 Tax=Candida theae TaxID=1198502 RepID=A0AAD5G0B1_9ASCO|nr:SED4 [Candida theae]KAI5964495.1 SED4 [Candida theae]
MALKENAFIDVGYPVLDAKFINNRTVLVAGGGGEGNNGIPNKITAIKCSFKVNDVKRRLQKFREVSLPPNEDSPQCIDATRLVDENEYNVVVGCNQSSELIKSMNINNNVRKYKYNREEHLIFDDAAQFEEEISGDADEYPKVIKISQDNTVGCLMTSAVPSVLYFFSPDALESKFKYKPPGNDEIKDFALSPKTGATLCYITSSSVVSVSTQTNSVIATSKTAPVDKQLQKFTFSKVKFINRNEVVISYSVKGGKGAGLLRYDLTKQKIVQEQVIAKKLNNIVAMDVSIPQDLVAFAGNDLVVYIVKLSNFKLLETMKKLHPFAITSVSFSPNGTKLTTGSAANILNVVRVPPKYASGKSVIGTLFQYLFTIILIAAFGIGIQKAHQNGQLHGVIESSKQFSENYREVGLRYGKIGSELASQYGNVGLELADEYGKKAYALVEEYGNKYSSKAIEFYKKKFGKEDLVNKVGDQAKSTLNDIVQEVTRDLHVETNNPEFDSETLDDIKLSTGVVESSVETSLVFSADSTTDVASTTEVSTSSIGSTTVADPEYESIHEVANNATVGEEAQQVEHKVDEFDHTQVSEDNHNENGDVNDADVHEIRYEEEYADIIEEVVYEDEPSEEDVSASNTEREETSGPSDVIDADGDYVEVVEEIVEEVESSSEASDVGNSDSPIEDDEYVEVVEEVVEGGEEEEQEEEQEGEEKEEAQSNPMVSKDYEEESNSEKSSVGTEAVEEVYEEVIEELDPSSLTQDEGLENPPSAPSQNDRVDVEETTAPNINDEALSDEPTQLSKISDVVKQPVEESTPIISQTQKEISSQEQESVVSQSESLSSENPSSSVSEQEFASEEAESHHESRVESSKVNEESSTTTKANHEGVIQDSVPSEPAEEKQVDTETAETASSHPTSIATDTIEEVSFSVQSVNEPVASAGEEFTPEEPVSLETPHTVEVSGTGGVDPTPKPKDAENVEEPPVSVSTPSSEAVAADKKTSRLTPPDEEASTLKPTKSANDVNFASQPSASTTSSARKVTRVVTRTIKRSKAAAPTKNAREKDEL